MTSEDSAPPAVNFAEEAMKMAKASEASEPFVMPPDIKFKSSVFDAAFHPTENIVAIGLVSGFLKMFVFLYTIECIYSSFFSNCLFI